MAHDFNEGPILIDNGAGKRRRIIDETSSSMSVEGKIGSLELLQESPVETPRFHLFICRPGSSTVSKSTMQGLEKFDCMLYRNQKISLINNLWHYIF